MVTLAVLTLQAYALDVVNSAGGLRGKVKDLNIAELKVTGTMNAEDFYFIADNLSKLSTVDLKDVKVVGCSTAKVHYWLSDFKDNEIPTGAFADMNLTQVSLPVGVKAIGKGAFAGCEQLATITWPNALDSIAEFAFAGCSALTAVSLPANLTVVGNGAFMRCSNLTSVIVNTGSKLRKLSDAALMDCPKLKTISLGTSLQEVGERALAGTAIQNLDFTSSKILSDVGDWVMVKTPVIRAKFPASLKHLGQGAFLYAQALNQVTLGGNLATISDYLLAGTALAGSLSLDGLVSMGNYALYNVSTLSVVELPATVTWLGSHAMAGMTGMTSITCDATTVPQLGGSVWQGVDQSQVMLKVPLSSVNQYKATRQWRNFMFPPMWVTGDVNGDGEVNIADINALIDVILGGDADADQRMRADVNSDGEVNIADINALIDIILGEVASFDPLTVTIDQLRLEDLAIRPNEVRTVQVALDNAGGYSAVQCDITLPQGLTLLDVKAAQSHESEACDIDDNTSRALAYSMSKNEFDGDVVLTLTLKADATLGTDGQILLTNVILSDADNMAWHAADVAATVTNSTGVEELTLAADHKVWAEGHILCVETRQDGVAQVVAINGATTDVQLSSGINRHELEPGFYVVVLNGKSHKIAIR